MHLACVETWSTGLVFTCRTSTRSIARRCVTEPEIKKRGGSPRSRNLVESLRVAWLNGSHDKLAPTPKCLNIYIIQRTFSDLDRNLWVNGSQGYNLIFRAYELAVFNMFQLSMYCCNYSMPFYCSYWVSHHKGLWGMGRIDSSSKHGPTSRCLARRGPWSFLYDFCFASRNNSCIEHWCNCRGRVHILPEVASHCTVCLQISWRFFPNGRHPGSSMGENCKEMLCTPHLLLSSTPSVYTLWY